jgi:hypothetical protein
MRAVHGFVHGRQLKPHLGARRSLLNEEVADDQLHQGVGHLAVGIEVGLQVVLHGERDVRVSLLGSRRNNGVKIRSGIHLVASLL